MNTWVELDETKLVRNLRALEHAAGPATEVLAVVKANAYGHGAERCSVALVGAGAQWLGVTCADEGVRVREALTAAGLTADVLVMSGFLPGDVAAMREYALTPVLWTADHVAWLTGGGWAVHVEVDTGMGRQGVRPGDELAQLLSQMDDGGIALDGIFTHFCSSEQAGSALTQQQERGFDHAVAQIAGRGSERGLRPAWVHAGNSSTVDNPAQASPWLASLAATVGARAMVRTGLALYGFCLPIEGAAPHQVQARLEPVMTWKARVLSVRDLAPGETVGYNATFTAPHARRIALLPAGYADGLRRELSWRDDGSGGWVMIAGKRASILGRVSMNLTVVDVTGLGPVAPGDEAILLGPGITAEDHARLAGTISYEILCGVKAGIRD